MLRSVPGDSQAERTAECDDSEDSDVLLVSDDDDDEQQPPTSKSSVMGNESSFLASAPTSPLGVSRLAKGNTPLVWNSFRKLSKLHLLRFGMICGSDNHLETMGGAIGIIGAKPLAPFWGPGP